MRTIKTVGNLLNLLWPRHRINIAIITLSILVILLIFTSSISVASGESISLNECTIRGADSYGKQPDYRMWHYNGDKSILLPECAFEWAQFFDAGDNFGYVDWDFGEVSGSEDNIAFTSYNFKARACSDCGGGTDDIQLRVTAEKRGYLNLDHEWTENVPYNTSDTGWMDFSEPTLNVWTAAGFFFAKGYDEMTFTLVHLGLNKPNFRL